MPLTEKEGLLVPVLRHVLNYPVPPPSTPGGVVDPEAPWHHDRDANAFVGASMGLFTMYGEELGELGVEARTSEVRFSTHAPAGPAVVLELSRQTFPGFDFMRLRVASGFADLDHASRAWAALAAIDTGLTQLAGLRGWDADRIAQVRGRLVARGLRFTWASPWKWNASRTAQVRGLYSIERDGEGRAQLEVRARLEDVIARSGIAFAWRTKEGAIRSAKTIRWQSGDVVTFEPWRGPFQDSHGTLALDVTTTEDLIPSLLEPPVAMAEPSGSLPDIEVHVED